MTVSPRAAQEQGREAVAVDHAIDGIRSSTSLPLLWLAGTAPVEADAVSVRPDEEHAHELETVMEVRDEQELEEALEAHDPEILTISPGDNGGDPLRSSRWSCSPDVPARKLAIADVDVGDRDQVLKLHGTRRVRRRARRARACRRARSHIAATTSDRRAVVESRAGSPRRTSPGWRTCSKVGTDNGSTRCP